jgi:ornithine cyclodeaminase/alanine dehydrogenase-like protein (mu-crystallin family)
MATPAQTPGLPAGKVLLLKEHEVRQLLTMEMALDAVERALRAQALEEAVNVPRGRAQTDHAMLHSMAGAIKGMGAFGAKVYATSKKYPSRFLVPLFDGRTAALLALIQADYLGQVRTGAASGVATKYLANPDVEEVGLYGTGKQARTQIEAVCKVRPVKRVSVYSPTVANRIAFATEMSQRLGVAVEAVEEARKAAQGKGIVITATSSRDPVLQGDWLAPGTHLNVIGSNFLAKAEVDVNTLRRANLITIDSKDQGRLEAGDFQRALEEGVLKWPDVHELGQILVGRVPGRQKREDITLFKSLGLAIEDVAVAAQLYHLAVQQGVGTVLDWE